METINRDCNRKYGIMMDGTVDISGTDQLNIVARFDGTNGKVEERLLGFEVITFTFPSLEKVRHYGNYLLESWGSLVWIKNHSLGFHWMVLQRTHQRTLES